MYGKIYGFHMCHYDITSNKDLITVIQLKGYMIYFTQWKPFTTATLYSVHGVHLAILISHVHIHMHLLHHACLWLAVIKDYYNDCVHYEFRSNNIYILHQ